MAAIKEKFWLDGEKAALVVIDVQEKLAPAMDVDLYAQLLEHAKLLIEGFRALDLPVIATEQYSKGLGHTVTELDNAAARQRIEKMTFSCCGEDSFIAALEATHAKQVVIVALCLFVKIERETLTTSHEMKIGEHIRYLSRKPF